MSVEQTNIIDFVSIGKTNGVVNLTAVDPLDWIDQDSHLVLLQDKINAYLRFIESGEIDRVYPKAAGRKRSINIIARCEPTKAGFELLRLIRDLVENAGFGFRFELRPNLTISEDE